MISKRLQDSTMSAIVQMSEKAHTLKSQGKPVMNLCLGEPDFDTPEHIGQAAVKAIDNHDTHYPPTSGTAALKHAVCQILLRNYQIVTHPDEILIGNGAKQLLFNAFFATLNPQDEVIIPAPFWSSYTDIVRICDGISHIVNCTEENHFTLSPAQLEAAISSNTRWLLLNSPANPTGAVYTSKQWRALAEVLKRHPHVWIMCDDIYQHLVYDQNYQSFIQMVPELASRTLMISGLSKAYAMTGWRVGYAYGPTPLIKAMTAIQNYTTSGVCTIAQAAAVAALTGDQSLLVERREIFRQRRERLVTRINSIKGLSCQKPCGAFYAFVHCQALFGEITPQGKKISNDIDVCHYLLDHALVATVPGSAFGAPEYFRLSFACSWEILNDACDAIERACQHLYKNHEAIKS